MQQLRLLSILLLFSILLFGCAQSQTSSNSDAQKVQEVKNPVNGGSASAALSICSPENGEKRGNDCKFQTQPAQLRFDETGECGSSLTYNCNDHQYSKYQNGCVGNSYYDFSGGTVTLQTSEAPGGSCVSAGSTCEAAICNDDERCGGSKKASECGVQAGECNQGFATLTGGVSSRCVASDVGKNKEQVYYIKGNQAYYDVVDDGETSRVIFKPNGFYIQMKEEQKSKPGPFQGCDWMFFGGCSVSPAGSFASVLTPNEFNSRNMACQPAEVDDTQFLTTGKVCDWKQAMSDVISNLPFGK